MRSSIILLFGCKYVRTSVEKGQYFPFHGLTVWFLASLNLSSLFHNTVNKNIFVSDTINYYTISPLSSSLSQTTNKIPAHYF